MLNPVTLLASTLPSKLGGMRPTYVLIGESRYTSSVGIQRYRLTATGVLVAYRNLPERLSRAGTIVCRAVKVSEVSRFEGSMPQVARPGGVEAAAFSPISGDMGDRGWRVYFWRVAPPARLGGATLTDSIGLGGWLPGRRAFAVFERPGPPDRTGIDLKTGKRFSASHPLSYATRVLSPEGKTLAYLPRTLKIVGAPPPGPLLAVRHSMPDAEIELAEHEGDPMRMARAIAAGPDPLRSARLELPPLGRCILAASIAAPARRKGRPAEPRCGVKPLCGHPRLRAELGFHTHGRARSKEGFRRRVGVRPTRLSRDQGAVRSDRRRRGQGRRLRGRTRRFSAA